MTNTLSQKGDSNNTSQKTVEIESSNEDFEEVIDVLIQELIKLKNRIIEDRNPKKTFIAKTIVLETVEMFKNKIEQQYESDDSEPKELDEYLESEGYLDSGSETESTYDLNKDDFIHEILFSEAMDKADRELKELTEINGIECFCFEKCLYKQY